MKKTYTISDESFKEAKEMIIENGTLYKDGSFDVQGVKGAYGKDGDQLTVTIVEKPWLASWSMIEDKLDEFFTN